MFDIGWSELLVIAVVALIVIGPKELPEVLRTFGRAVNKLRRSADDFRRQFEDSVRDTGYEDLQQNLREFRQMNPGSQIRESIDRALNSDETPNTNTANQPDAKPADLAPSSAVNGDPPGKADVPPATGQGSASIFKMTPPSSSQEQGETPPKQPEPPSESSRTAPQN